MTPAKRVPPIIVSFFAVDASLIVLHVLGHTIRSLPSGAEQFVDLNRELNLPTWFSSMQWLCVAAPLLALAWRLVRRSESGGRVLLALGLLFLCLSLDEIAQIHERLGLRSDGLLPSGTREGGVFPQSGIWMFVIGIPVLALFAVVIRSAASRLRSAPRAFTKIAVGLALTAFGAMGIDLLGNLLYRRGSRISTLEEAFELFGSTIVLWGSLELLKAHGLRFGAHEAETTES